MLFYHGVKRPYPHTDKMRFVDCFEDVKLAEWLYHSPFPLVDISTIPDEEILTHRSVALLEAEQKHIHVRDDLMEVASLFSQALDASKLPRELFRRLVYYGDSGIKPGPLGRGYKAVLQRDLLLPYVLSDNFDRRASGVESCQGTTGSRSGAQGATRLSTERVRMGRSVPLTDRSDPKLSAGVGAVF